MIHIPLNLVLYAIVLLRYLPSAHALKAVTVPSSSLSYGVGNWMFSDTGRYCSADHHFTRGYAGASVSYNFTGTQLSIDGFTFSDGGVVEIVVDNVTVSVNTQTPGAYDCSANIYSTSSLHRGDHRLIMRTTDTETFYLRGIRYSTYDDTEPASAAVASESSQYDPAITEHVWEVAYSKGKKSNIGSIVGGAIGGVVGLGLVVVAILLRRRGSTSCKHPNTPETLNTKWTQPPTHVYYETPILTHTEWDPTQSSTYPIYQPQVLTTPTTPSQFGASKSASSGEIRPQFLDMHQVTNPRISPPPAPYIVNPLVDKTHEKTLEYSQPQPRLSPQCGGGVYDLATASSPSSLLHHPTPRRLLPKLNAPASVQSIPMLGIAPSSTRLDHSPSYTPQPPLAPPPSSMSKQASSQSVSLTLPPYEWSSGSSGVGGSTKKGD